MTSTEANNSLGSAASVAGALSGVLALAALYSYGITRSPLGFEYPLDDVYIHLSMAEQIASGGYGVNAEEYASAASSPLYPFLLMPFAGSELQRWLPLFWNVTAVAAAGALFGAIASRAQMGRVGVLVAVAAPFSLNMYVTAYTGMENMAHGAATLMVVLGLWNWVEHRRLGWLLVLGVTLAPLLRLEGLAIAMAASVVLVLTGSRKTALALAALALFPLLLFMAFLVHLGLDPLPNSVIAKLSDSAGEGQSTLTKIISRFQANAMNRGGTLLFVTTLALCVATLSIRATNPRRALFGGAIAAAGLAHLAFGSIGWMDRYENYAVLGVSSGLILVLRDIKLPIKATIVAAVFVGATIVYFPPVLKAYSWNVAAIRLQQGEMARFAKNFAAVPVAVNDLGYVSWKNPNYVLDLWGLASSEALRTRLSEPPSGWGGPLVSKHGVELVMIYDRWLGDAISPDWVPLGTLHLLIPRSFIGGYEVLFMATSEDAARSMRVKLKDWESDLPDMTRFEWASE